jgi:hypothetical protein
MNVQTNTLCNEKNSKRNIECAKFQTERNKKHVKTFRCLILPNKFVQLFVDLLVKCVSYSSFFSNIILCFFLRNVSFYFILMTIMQCLTVVVYFFLIFLQKELLELFQNITTLWCTNISKSAYVQSISYYL